MNSSSTITRLRVVVLISGRGSNLQAIIDNAEKLGIDLCGVVSNNLNAAGLEKARAHGIATAVVAHRDYPSRETFDVALMACIDRFEPGLVVLAGFMRVLSSGFVQRYHGRLINIHPSLLPDLPGLNTHQRALDEGRAEHGASVHFVTDGVDEGPVIVQQSVPVLPDDSADSLAARVLAQEHRLLPQVIAWFAAGRLAFTDGHAMLDGQPAKDHATLTDF